MKVKTIRVDEDVYNELSELALALRMTITGLASNILRASLAEAKREVEKARRELNPLLGPVETAGTAVKRDRSDDWLWLLGIIGVALFLAARKKGGAEHARR